MAQIGRCLAQVSSGGAVRNNWFLLESCSTIRCAKNNLIISNVKMSPSEENLRVCSNGGRIVYTMRGTLDILPMGVYVNDNSMVNILSLKEVADSFRITMYTKEYHAMLVHYRNDKACRFKECGKGIYYLDIEWHPHMPPT